MSDYNNPEDSIVLTSEIITEIFSRRCVYSVDEKYLYFVGYTLGNIKKFADSVEDGHDEEKCTSTRIVVGWFYKTCIEERDNLTQTGEISCAKNAFIDAEDEPFNKHFWLEIWPELCQKWVNKHKRGFRCTFLITNIAKSA